MTNVIHGATESVITTNAVITSTTITSKDGVAVESTPEGDLGTWEA